MAKDEDLVINIKAGDIPEIRGLIEALTNVAEAGTNVVDAWNREMSEDWFEGYIGRLRDSLLALNEYVDRNISDD